MSFLAEQTQKYMAWPDLEARYGTSAYLIGFASLITTLWLLQFIV